MILKSDYEDGSRLPNKHANHGVPGGENVSPPFSWDDVPAGTQSFALIIVDEHPVARRFIHWLVVDIPGLVRSIEEGASPHNMPAGARELNTSYGRPWYGGPRPPAATGDHEYVTTLYALRQAHLPVAADVTLEQFEAAVKDKFLASASLTGLYSQP
jgi:Raf kinase inhibitor-like YbhB/YbcL family protein